MKKFIVLFLILSIISCVKDECDFAGDYEFKIHGDVTPYDSVFQIGDTLFLNSKYHFMVFEEKTGSFYNLKNINNTEASLWIYNLDTVCEDLDARVTDFVDIIANNEFNYEVHQFSNGQNAIFSNIKLEGDTFRNSCNIVFKRKGLYLLSYGIFSNENNSDFEGKCNSKAFNIYTRLNDENLNNIKLLAQSKDEHFSNWMLIQHPIDNFYNRGCFAYRVID